MSIFLHVRSFHSKKRGFSLIELLVVAAIITIISAIILSDTSGFNNSLLLGDLAYNIALSVRTAQSYGVSTREISSGFTSGYGIYFPGTGKTYYLFADRDGDGVYNPAGLDGPVLQTYTLASLYTLSSVCAYPYAVPCTTTAAYIVFRRPDPRAYIATKTDSNPVVPGQGGVLITIQSPKGNTRSVEIRSSGQVSIRQS